MNLHFSNLDEALLFSQFLFDSSPLPVFLVDAKVKIRLVNEAYKKLFCTSDCEALGKYCGNGFGCAFAVEAQCNCGDAPECAACELRGCIVKAFRERRETHKTRLEQVFYINGVAGFKFLDIYVRQITYNGEIMAAIIIENISDVKVE